jgi:cell division protein FtsI/penicillin-binding protein 2
MALPNTNALVAEIKRVRIVYGLLLLIVAVFGVRLFYLQIIRYGHYKSAAMQQQFADYQIPAERGLIEAHDGDKILPLVLNQKLYTLYADPKFIKDPHADAAFVASVIGGSAEDYEKLMRNSNRYDVLAKKVPEDKKDKLLAAKRPGINAQAQTYRVYPNGSLAANLLGFVSDDGKGTYGIEQVLNNSLSGKPGLLKAVTDVNGVPLPASSNNVEIAPQPGKNVVLTIDATVQHQAEQALEKGLKHANSTAGSAIVMDVHTGAIVAMADYPTYDPGNYAAVTDPSVFNNAAVSNQLEVGSIMKVLTTTAALDQGTITPTTTYYDSGAVTVDGFTITNVEPLPSHQVSIQDVLRLSLNTGAVHILSTLGGGQINAQARNTWHDYLVNHYLFGKPTGIEQSYEASGLVPDPNKGDALSLHYAETAFGQGISVTMLQMASALSAVLNGGTYYQPHLVDGYADSAGNLQQLAPKIKRTGVVKPQVGQDIFQLLKNIYSVNYVVYRNHLHAGFTIGGKTGTAQIPVNGGYDPNYYNGTFLGFVGGDQPQYVIAVMAKAPQLPGYEYAGSQGAAPVFGSIVDSLINDGRVTPQTR